MTWLIIAAVLLAWGPLALGLGLLVGPVLRRGAAVEAPLAVVAVPRSDVFVLR